MTNWQRHRIHMVRFWRVLRLGLKLMQTGLVGQSQVCDPKINDCPSFSSWEVSCTPPPVLTWGLYILQAGILIPCASSYDASWCFVNLGGKRPSWNINVWQAGHLKGLKTHWVGSGTIWNMSKSECELKHEGQEHETGLTTRDGVCQ